MRFCAVEYVLPSKQVTNDDMIEAILAASKHNFKGNDLKLLALNLNLLFKASWTNIRYHRDKDEEAYILTVKVGEKALQRAGMSPLEIDLLIYVGVGRGFIEPGTANLFQDLLGLEKATCFDVMDACMSWLRALDIAHTFLKTKKYKNIMILNGEFNFKEYVHLEFKSLEELEFNYPTFTIGEAATATILSNNSEDDDDEYYAEFKTWGNKRNLCMIPLPNSSEYGVPSSSEINQPLQFFSYGEKLFKFVAPKIVHQYRQNPHFNSFPHDIVFTHAASDAATHKLLKVCKLGMEKGYYTHGRFGNTVSASVPLAMSLAKKEGKLQKGGKVLLAFGSAGISTAWCRFKFL